MSAFRRALLLLLVVAVLLPPARTQAHEACDGSVAESLTADLGLKKMGWRQCRWDITVTDSLDIIDGSWPDHGTFASRPACAANKKRKLFFVDDCNTTACTAGGGTIKCATWCNPSGFVWDSLTCDSSGGGASPGGPQFAVQINDPLGSFGGSSSLSFSSNTLSVNNKILPTAIAFASLGTPANGTIAYCNNCVKGSDPCAGAGTGSLAVRLNNTWVCSGGGGTPAGSNTEIQFNASGAFGADPDFAWDSTNNILRVGEDTTPATDAFIQVRGTNDVDFRVAADVASLSNTQPGISGGPSSGDLVIRAANDGISDVFVAVEDDLRVTSFDRLTNYLRVEGSGSGAPGTIHMPLYKADTGGFCDGFTKPRLEPDVNGLLTCVQEGSASAGGSEDEVQIHGPAGVFVGDPDFQWSPSLNLMTVKGEIRLEETGAGADLVTLRAQADITDPISLTFDSLSPTSYVLQFDTTAGTLVDFDATVGELTLAADRLVADTQTGGGSECAEFTATGELVRSGTGACSSATPGGNPTEIQFHDTGGVFAGDADFTWDKVNNVLRVGEATTPATDAYIQVRGTNDIDLRVASDVANLVATQPGVSGGPSSASLILQAGNDGTADIIAAIEDDFRVMTFDRTADYVRVEGAASAAPGSVHFALYKNDVGGFCNGLTAPRLEPDATGLLTCVEDIASAPGGSETEVQFHDTGGVLGGDPELVYDKTGNVLGLTGTLRLIDPTGSDTFDIATGDMAGNVAMTVDADVFSGPTPIEVKIQTNYSLNTTWSFENIDGGATAELQVEGLAGGTTACVEATGTGQLVRTPSGLACGAGSINAVPTPADNQIAVFTDADTVEGDVNFTWEKTNRAFTINSDEGDFFTRSVCSLGTEPGSTCMVDSDCAGGGSCDGIQFGFDDDHLSGGGFDARRDDLVFETFDRDPKRAGFYGVFLSRLVGRESQDNKFLDGIHGGNETVVINANEHNAVPRIAVAHGDNTAAPTIADLGWAGCDREGNTPWACRTVAAFMPGSDNAPIPNIHAQPQWGDQSGGVIHAKGHAQRIPDPIGCAWCEGGNMAGRCCEEADEATECTTEGGTCTGVSQDPLVTADIAAGCDINTGTYYVAYAWQEDVPGPYRTMRSRIVSHNVASSGDGFTIKLPSAIQSGGFPPNVDRAVVYLDVNNFGNVIKQGYITTPTGSLQWCTQGPGNGLVEEEVAFGLNQTGADVFAAYDPKNHTLCSVKFDNATAYNSCTLDDEPTQCRAAQQGMCGRPSAIFWQHPSQLTADLWQAREWDMDLLARLTSDGSLILGGDGIPVGSGADFFFDTANTVIQTSGRADQTVCDAAGEHMLFYDNTVNTWIGCENGVPKDISQGSPGGNVTELQFHDFGGVFQGDPELTYNKTADILTLRGALRFLELSGGSSEIIIKPPVNLSVNSDYTLPTADGSSGQTLHTTGTGDLFWGGINLATEVLGLLAPANGGTGITTASSSGIPRVASGTWSVSDLSAQLSDGLQDETGTGGVAVFSLQPTISAPLLTGRPVVGDGVGNDYLEFTEEATDPTAQCVTNAYFIWANSGGTLKKCENGTISVLDTAGTPAGNDTQVQFNDGGTAFGGDPELTYNKSGNILSLRGTLRFQETGGGAENITFQAASDLGGNTAYILPTADGSAGHTMHTDGAGNLYWSTIILSNEVVGLLPAANGGTGINSGSATGIPRVASGVWSVSDLSSQLSDGLQDETGTGGVAVFSLQPTISGPLLTGRPVVGDGVGNDYLEFTEEATDPTAECVTNAYFIWANNAGTLKKCENGTITNLDTAGVPGGNDTQVQFNDGGMAFGGDPELTYNKSGNILSLRGTLRFQETGGGAENITFQAASDLGGNTAYILPTADGSAGHTMHTDGAGNLYWSTVILSNEVVGLLPAANGGTGINSGSSSGLPRVASGVWSVSNLSSQLANALIDEQGTGSVVFATTPTITTPLIAGRPIVGDGAGNDFLEFTEESTDAVASCAANMYFLSANSTTGTLRKCENGVLSDLDSGDVSASGSPVADQVTVWTGASTITGDAGFTYDTAGNVITLKGPFRFQETGAGTEFVAVQAAAALAANTTYTLPTADGSTGHTLHTDGGGTLFWSQVNLGNEVVGLLPSGNGGTGLNTGSSNGLPRVASGSWSVSNLSVQLANAVTDETGTGSVVFATQPTITTPLLSGRPVVGDGVGNDYLEFTEEATDPTAQCATNAYFIWANSAGTLKKCENGTISNLDTSAITVSGTPQNDQLAVWVNSTTLEGDAALKFDTVTDTLEVESTAPKLLFDDTTASAIDAQVFVDANVLTVETGTGTDWQRIDLATGTFDLPAYATCSALGNSGKLTVDGSGNLNCADDIDTSADTLCAGSDTYLDGDGNCDTVSGDLIGSLNVVQVINDSHQHDVDTTVEGWSAWDSAVTKQTASLVISGVEVDFETGALEGYPRLGQSATPPATACDAAGEAGRLYFDTDADTDGSVFVCRGAAGWKNIDDDGEGGVLISGTPADNQLAVWINSTTIEGDAALKFDTVTDTLEVESTAPKFLFDDTTGAAVDVQFLVDGNVFTLETGTGTDVQRIDMATGTFDLPVYATCSALGNAGKLTVDGGGNLICAADIDTSADTLCAGSDTYLDGDGNCDTVSGDLIGSLNVVQVINDSHQHDIDISIDGLTAWDGAATKQTADLVISGVEVDFEVGALEGFPRLAQSTTPPATACDAAAEAGRLYFDSDADTDGSVFVCRGTAGWKNIDDDGEGSAGISGVPVDNQVAVWLNATTLEGDAGFVYDGATARLILLSTAPTLRLEDTSAGAVDAHILADANDLIIESSDGTDRVRVNLSNSSLDLPGYTSCAALGNAGKLTVDGSGNVLCAADIDTSADTLCVGTDTYLDGDGNCDTVSGDLIGSLNVVQVVNDSHQHDVDTSISGWTTWDSAVTKQTSSLIVSGTEVDFEGGAAEGFPRLGQSTLPPATACDAAGEAGRLYFDTDADTDGSVFVCRGTSGWKNIDDDGEGAVLVSGTPVNDQLAVWTNSTTIEGDSGLKFDTITDTLEIESTAPRFLLDDTTVSAVDAQVFVDANVLTVETGTGVDWLRLDLASGTFDLPAYTTCAALGNGGKLTVDGGGNLNCASDVDTDTDSNANTLCTGSDTYLDGDGNCDTVSGDLIGSLNVVQVVNDSHQHDIDISISGLTVWDGSVTKQTSPLVVSGTEVDFEGGAAEGFPRLGQSTLPPATACDAAGEAGRLYFDTDADTDGSVFVCRGVSGWKNIDDDGEGSVLVSGTPVNDQLAVWTSSTTIEGDIGLKFDTITDTLEIESTAPRFLLDDTTVSAVDAQVFVDGNVLTVETGTGVDWLRLDLATGTFDLPAYTTCAALGNAGKLTVDGAGNLNCASDVDTDTDSRVTVEEDDVTRTSNASFLNFGLGFDVTNSPAGQANVTLDYTEDPINLASAEIAGILLPASGGTGLDTSASTGVLRVSAGTWVVGADISALNNFTSAQLDLRITDDTGSGVAVFNTSPVFDGTPVIGNGIGNDKLEFNEESTNPSCGAAQYTIWANSGNGKLKKCENFAITDLDTNANTLCTGSNVYLNGDGACDVVSGDLSGSLSSVNVVDDSHFHDVDVSLTGWSDWGQNVLKTGGDLGIWGTEVDFEQIVEGFPRLAQSTLPPSAACDASAEAGRLYFDTDADTDGSVFVCRGLSGWKDIDDDGGHGDGTNCSAGFYPLGVDANGNAQSCTADDDIPETGDFGNAFDLDANGDVINDSHLHDVDSTVSGWGGWAAAVTKTSQAINIWGTEVNYENAVEGFPRLAQSATPPATECDAAAEAGRLYFDTDADVTGAVYVCTGAGGWKPIQHDNGSNCGVGAYARGVDEFGNAESCTVDDDIPEVTDFTNFRATRLDPWTPVGAGPIQPGDEFCTCWRAFVSAAVKPDDLGARVLFADANDAVFLAVYNNAGTVQHAECQVPVTSAVFSTCTASPSIDMPPGMYWVCVGNDNGGDAMNATIADTGNSRFVDTHIGLSCPGGNPPSSFTPSVTLTSSIPPYIHLRDN